GRRALLVEFPWIDEDTGLVRLIRIGEDHEEGLFLRWLFLHGEELSAAPDESAVADRFRSEDFLEPGTKRINASKLVEDATGVIVLGIAPGLDVLAGAVLEPAIVVGDAGAVVRVGHRLLLRRRRRGQDEAGDQEQE